MEEVSEIVVGVLVTLLALIGLVLASGALDDEMYLFGFSLAAFGFVFNAMLIKKHHDRNDRKRVMARAGTLVRHD